MKKLIILLAILLSSGSQAYSATATPAKLNALKGKIQGGMQVAQFKDAVPSADANLYAQLAIIGIAEQIGKIDDVLAKIGAPGATLDSVHPSVKGYVPSSLGGGNAASINRACDNDATIKGIVAKILP